MTFMELILIKFEVTSICILNAFLVSTYYQEEWVGLCVTIGKFACSGSRPVLFTGIISFIKQLFLCADSGTP